MADRAKLRAMLAEATPGPWRAGRMDTESYDGSEKGAPWKAIYWDDPEAPEHLGAKLPGTVGRAYGDRCRPTAELIAAARNELPGLLDELDRAERERDEALDKWRRTHGEHSGRHPLLDGADGVLDQVRAVLEIPPGANVIEGARRLRAQAALALDRLKRIGRLEDDLQRIRIVATAGNPMSPKRAALCMSQVDEIARVALALSPPSPETAPAERFMALQAQSDALVAEARRAWGALSIEDRDRVRIANRQVASPETKDKE